MLDSDPSIIFDIEEIEKFNKAITTTVCPPIKIIENKTWIRCSGLIKSICLQIQETLIGVDKCTINELDSVVFNLPDNVINFPSSGEVGTNTNDSSEQQEAGKRTGEDKESLAVSVNDSQEGETMDIDHIQKTLSMWMKWFQNDSFSKNVRHDQEVRKGLMKILENYSVSYLMLRVDIKLEPEVTQCLGDALKNPDTLRESANKYPIKTYVALDAYKILGKCAIDNGEITINNIKILDKHLEKADLLEKYYKLQFIRLSSSSKGTDTDVQHNYLIGSCLGYEQENEDGTGVFHLNSRGYAVINPERFGIALDCAAPGTNLTVMLTNKNASPKYSLKPHFPKLIEAEKLLGADKEVSLQYRNLMISKIQELGNVSQEEAEKIATQISRKMMAVKLEKPPLPESSNIDWEALTKVGIIMGILSCGTGIFGGIVGGYLKYHHKLCFKLNREQVIETINNEKNIPLGTLQKSYGEPPEKHSLLLPSPHNKIATSQEERIKTKEAELHNSLINQAKEEEELSSEEQNLAILSEPEINLEPAVNLAGANKDNTSGEILDILSDL